VGRFAKLAASIQTTDNARRPASETTTLYAAGSADAVTITTSPALAADGWTPSRNRARP
jgi:hypothetical protein